MTDLKQAAHLSAVKVERELHLSQYRLHYLCWQFETQVVSDITVQWLLYIHIIYYTPGGRKYVQTV